MSLLDPKRSFYSLKNLGKGWVRQATSEIQDENGNKIGMLEGGGVFKKQVSVKDFDGKLILTLKKKFTILPEYTIFDPDEKILWTAKEPRVKDREMELTDKNGNLILRCEKRKEDKISIVNQNGKLVANFSFSYDEGKLGFFVKTRYGNFQIHDLSFDRLTLLGFLIAVFSQFFDAEEIDIYFDT